MPTVDATKNAAAGATTAGPGAEVHAILFGVKPEAVRLREAAMRRIRARRRIIGMARAFGLDDDAMHSAIARADREARAAVAAWKAAR